MLDADGEPIYVGKARSLAKRVANYTLPARLPTRLQRMVSETRSMLFVRTHTEVEALLLESNLIKRLRPRFNVLLRDDKSFPHIELSHRRTTIRASPSIVAAAQPGAAYFGPFASAGAVDRTIQALQRAFLIRSPAPTPSSPRRSRPCLQYQIKRCTGALRTISSASEAYAEQVTRGARLPGGAAAATCRTISATAMQKAARTRWTSRAAAALPRPYPRPVCHPGAPGCQRGGGGRCRRDRRGAMPTKATPRSKCSSSAPAAITATGPISPAHDRQP